MEGIQVKAISRPPILHYLIFSRIEYFECTFIWTDPKSAKEKIFVMLFDEIS